MILFIVLMAGTVALLALVGRFASPPAERVTLREWSGADVVTNAARGIATMSSGQRKVVDLAAKSAPLRRD